MEVQVQTVMSCQGLGWFVAALDEEGFFARISEEIFLNRDDAEWALSSGCWTPA